MINAQRKETQKEFLKLWGIETNKLQPSQKTTTVNKRRRNTTVKTRATLGFSLGQHARGSIWVVQDRGCSPQRSLTSEHHVMSAAWPTMNLKDNFLQLFQKKSVNICHHLPYHNRFSGVFISPQYICHVFIYEV